MIWLLACTDPARPHASDRDAVVDSVPDSPVDTGEPSCGTATFTTSEGATDLTQIFSDGTPITLDTDGTLAFCKGTWFVRATITAQVEVLGETADNTVLSGGEAGTVFVVEGGSLALEHATVDRGLAREEGNAGSGAGVRCLEGGSVTARSVVFSNHVAYDGAALFGRDGCSVVIEDSVFRGNVVDDDGGAVRVDRGTAVFREVLFEDNEARDGGAMILQESEVSIEGGAFRRNVVRDTQGGAILHYWGTLSASGTVFANNDANGRGGGLALFGDTALTGVSFTGNTTTFGGGIYVYTSDGTLTCIDCAFEDNHPDDVATDIGGSYDFDVASFTCDASGCGS